MVTSVTSGWGVDGDMMGVSLLLLDLVVAMVVWVCCVQKSLESGRTVQKTVTHFITSLKMSSEPSASFKIRIEPWPTPY